MKFRIVATKFMRYEYASDSDLVGRTVESAAPISGPSVRPDPAAPTSR